MHNPQRRRKPDAPTTGQAPSPDTEISVAEQGSLHPEVASDILVLHEFMQNRDKLFHVLLGRRVRRSPVRDELVRQIMIQFAQGHLQTVPFYIRSSNVAAAAPAIRSELALLSACRLVELRKGAVDKRTSVVAPTNKLVAFYNTQMPRLRTEVMRLLVQPPP